MVVRKVLQFFGPREAIHYSRSEAVRDLLAMAELAKNDAAMGTEERMAMRDAFGKVMDGLRSGRLTLDYQPAADGTTIDIPAVSHEHYMQALLYWCSRLKCTIPRLVDAYARLGARPTVEAMWAMVRRIEQEDAVAETAMASTAMPPDTRPSLLHRLTPK